MDSFPVLRLCFFCLVQAIFGLQPSDHLAFFASPGDSITLPCGIHSIKPCSSINWNMTGLFRLAEQVVTAGKVTVNDPSVTLDQHCNLLINHVEINHARHYTCDDGALSSSVSLEIPQITQEEAALKKNRIELHCSLNTFIGHTTCTQYHSGIQIKWLNEDNMPLKGSRFDILPPDNNCLSKLSITQKLTDHRMKWKCQVTQGESVKATVSYTTTVKDGVEEVFAVVGESVSLSCGNTSSLNMGDKLQWYRGDKPVPLGNELQVKDDSSLVIREVASLHSGDYQCLEDVKVANRVRLHTLDIAAEYGPEGKNFTLICSLTCALTKCEEEFNLTWTDSSQHGQQSILIHDKNTFISKLFLPDLQDVRDTIYCSASKEGVVKAVKRWPSTNTAAPVVAWVAVPLVLLLCVSAVGLYVCWRRKHGLPLGNEMADIGMTHVYDDILDYNPEAEPQQRQEAIRGTPTTNEVIYSLAQAVDSTK